VIDVLGHDLEHARRILEGAGCRLDITETRSPRRVTLTGALRVVRQRSSGSTVYLVVTRERYEPLARPSGA
jgi:hypothetical protein